MPNLLAFLCPPRKYYALIVHFHTLRYDILIKVGQPFWDDNENENASMKRGVFLQHLQCSKDGASVRTFANRHFHRRLGGN